MTVDHMETGGSRRRIEGPDKGWSWVIAFSCCFINCLLYGLARMSGLLLIAALEAFQIPRRSAAMPFSTSTSVRNLSGSFVGHLGQYFGIKPVIMIGCILAATGAGLCFFVNDIVWVTVFWGGLFGLGSGLATTLLPVAINQHFKNQRGTASGISYSGSYVGSLAFPPLIVLLLDKYGFSGTFLIISGLVLNVMAAAMLFRSPTWTETPETIPKFSAQKRIIDDRKIKFRRRSCARKLSEQYSNSEVREIVLKAQELDLWNKISPKLVEGKIEDQYRVRAMSSGHNNNTYFADRKLKDMMTEKESRKLSLDCIASWSYQNVWANEGIADFKNIIHKKVSFRIRCKRKWAKLKRIWTAFFRTSSYNLELTKTMQAKNEVSLVYFESSNRLCNNMQKHSSFASSSADICILRDVTAPIHEADEPTDEIQDDVEIAKDSDCKTDSGNISECRVIVPSAEESSKFRDLQNLRAELRSNSVSSNKSINNGSLRDLVDTNGNLKQPRLSLSRRYSQNIRKRTSDTSSKGSVHSVHSEQMNFNPKSQEQEVKGQTFIKGAGDCFLGWFKMFRNPMFVVIGGTQSLYTFVIVCTITIIEDFAKDLNAPRNHLHYPQMVLSITDLVGTLTLGWITDKGYMTRRQFISLCFFGMAASIAAISQSTDFTMMLCLISIYGIFESGVVITFPLLTAQFIKPEKQAVAIASTNTLAAPVVLMVPLVIGHFRDNLGCYSGLFYLLSGASLLSGLIWLLIPYILKIKSIKIQPEMEIDMNRDRLRYMRPSC